MNHSSNGHELPIYSKMVPRLLLKIVKGFETRKEPFSLLDVGCGQGEILFLLKSSGLLTKASITGLDINQKALLNFKKILTETNVIHGDIVVLNKLPPRSFELVIANQVIEHVVDEKFLLSQVRRVLKDDGYLFISSVIKKWYALYWHRNQAGQIVVDPTHLREYSSPEQFKKLLTEGRFRINKAEVYPGKICLGEYLLLLLKKSHLLRFSGIREYYARHPNIYQVVSKTTFLPLPGYATISVVAQKSHD